MKESTFDLIKKIILGIVLAALVFIFAVLLAFTVDDKFIKDIKAFIKTDTKVLYINNKENSDKYPTKIFEKYEINYKYINSSKLSRFERNKLQKIINNKDLSNIIVIFDSGKIKDAIIDYESEKKLDDFLIKNGVIPSILGNINGMMKKITDSLESDLLIMYLPYSYSDNISYQDHLLKTISKQYNVEYKKIDAYLLSRTQHEKMNKLLEISAVEDQIILFIKNKTIVGSLRGFIRKSEYINKLFEYGYVEEVYNSLNEISYNEFENEVSNSERRIILIIKDDCKYCKETMSLLDQISSSKNLDIDYINIGDMDSDISLNVEGKLQKMGYKDGFSTPLIIITEKEKVLDYSIGLSSLEFYEEMFSKYGLTK